MGEKGSQKRVFTDRFIKSLKPDPEREYMVTEARGLAIRVRTHGTMSWIHVYTWNGKQRTFTLGRYPDRSLADARDLLEEVRQKVAKGENPHEERKATKTARADTVGKLGKKFMKEHAIPKLKEKTWREYQRELNVYILPKWKNHPISEIAPADVRNLIKTVSEENGPIMANRVYSFVRKMFAFAQEEYLREDNPAASVKRINSEKSRDRILSESEIQGFWNGIEGGAVPDEIRGVLKFALVTAMRVGEIVEASWEYVDGKTLTLPETKGGRRHQVHLTDLAFEIAGTSKKSGLLFPREDGLPIPVYDLSKYVRRHLEDLGAVEPWTPHDLRRTAGSKMTEIGISRLVVSKILNHSDGSVTAVYDRTSYLPEMRKALERWSRYLRTMLGKEETQEKVVPIKGAS